MGRSFVAKAVSTMLLFALPGCFYLGADAVDAFPGVLTIHAQPAGPVAGVPASGEDLALARVASAPSAKKADAGRAELEAAMNAPASLPVVNGHLAYTVVDAKTGQVIAERDASTPRAPASTMKLVTALAATRVLGPDHRFSTTAVLSGSTLTLVGGGDMYLSADGSRTKDGLPRASLGTLADQTARHLKAAGATSVTLRVDDTYFAHDPVNPAWGDNGPSGGWVAPIMTLGIDGGRKDGTPYGPKSTDPAMDAARVYRAELEKRGIRVSADPARAQAPANATRVARIESAPLNVVVEHTLLMSDNTMAELLARHTAKALGLPTTVEGAKSAVRKELEAVLAESGVPLDGTVIADNSGLSTSNRLSPSLLAHINAWAASSAPPDVRDMFAHVPVGGLSGTLAERFGGAKAVSGKGIVRGKTGYLGGVSSLSGTTVLADGRLVGYCIYVYGFDGAAAKEAKAAVDQIAAAMVNVAPKAGS